MKKTSNFFQQEIVDHLKNNGFVFSCSEIYNGIANG